MQSVRTCIYCGNSCRGVRRGEHVVPRSLGCTRTLKSVCQECNGHLSIVDKELVSKSPLEIIASEELDKTADGIWDYNAQFDVSLEAYVLPGHEAPMLWPQVVFEDRGPAFWLDAAEGRRVGKERFLRALFGCLMRARQTLEDGRGRPAWLWKPLDHPPRRGRFPPRAYTRHAFHELSGSVHVECRYVEPVDRGRILWSLDNWRPFDGRLKLKESWGGEEPEVRLSFRPRHVLRALVKIGINLLAYVCRETSVDKESFAEAISFARFDRGAGPCLEDSGFVWNDDVQALKCPASAHRFRLTHWQNWGLDCAFFGGRIGATVAFPGPNSEAWTRADITAPIGSSDWKVATSRIQLPRTMHVDWFDLPKLAPSVPWRNVHSRVRVHHRPGD